MALPQFRAISGARARLFFQGKEAGWATGCGVQENITQVPVEVLGDIDPQDIEATSRQVTMTADFVRIKKKDLMVMGIWPRGPSASVIEFPAMSSELYDVVSDELIMKVEGLKPTSRNWRLDRAGLLTSSASYLGIRVYDEVDG